jgi:hypothetical protein
MKKLPVGYTRVPWGFLETANGLVANSTVRERNQRTELGEFAILLLGKLGISEEVLGMLVNEAEPLAALKKILDEANNKGR